MKRNGSFVSLILFLVFTMGMSANRVALAGILDGLNNEEKEGIFLILRKIKVQVAELASYLEKVDESQRNNYQKTREQIKPVKDQIAILHTEIYQVRNQIQSDDQTRQNLLKTQFEANRQEVAQIIQTLHRENKQILEVIQNTNKATLSNINATTSSDNALKQQISVLLERQNELIKTVRNLNSVNNSIREGNELDFIEEIKLDRE